MKHQTIQCYQGQALKVWENLTKPAGSDRNELGSVGFFVAPFFWRLTAYFFGIRTSICYLATNYQQDIHAEHAFFNTLRQNRQKPIYVRLLAILPFWATMT